MDTEKLTKILDSIEGLAKEAKLLFTAPPPEEVVKVRLEDLAEFAAAGGKKATFDANGATTVTLRGVKSSDGMVLDFSETLISSLTVVDCANIEIRSPNIHGGANPSGKNRVMYRVYEDCDRVHLHSAKFQGGPDKFFKSWAKETWESYRNSTALVQGTNCNVTECYAVGVHSGFFMAGSHGRISSCAIEGFSGDSYRVTASFSGVENCKAACSVGVFAPEFHVDLVQIFPNEKGGELEGVYARQNVLLEWDGEEDSHPLRHAPQGIVGFDGILKDFDISGNRVETDHYHGITMLGISGSSIVGNVIRPYKDQADERWPRLMVADSKTGLRSKGNTVSGNVLRSERALKISQES